MLAAEQRDVAMLEIVERIVDTYVRRLRRKLEAVDAAYDGIETVIGAGYRLRAVG